MRKAACKAGLTIYGEEPEAYLVQNASFYELMAELAASVQYDIRRYPGYADSPAEGQLVAEIGAYIDANCDQKKLPGDIAQGNDRYGEGGKGKRASEAEQETHYHDWRGMRFH